MVNGLSCRVKGLSKLGQVIKPAILVTNLGVFPIWAYTPRGSLIEVFHLLGHKVSLSFIFINIAILHPTKQ